MAIVIDPGQGALAQAVGNLGTAVANRINEQNLREKELGADPSVLARLAPAARRALEAGQLASFAKSLKVRPEYVKTNIIDAFQPTDEEIKSDLYRKGGGLEAEVGAAIGTNKVTQRTNQAQLEAGLPESTAKLKALQTLTETESLQALRDSGFVKADVDSKMAKLSADTAQDTARAGYWNLFQEQGGVKLQVDADTKEFKDKIRTLGIREDAAKTYVDAINSIDQSTPEGRHAVRMAAAFIENPGFANYLAQQESQDFQTGLAKLKANPSEKDKLELTISTNTEMQKRVDALQKLIADGAPEDQIKAARAQLANWTNIAQDLQSRGVIHNFDLVGSRPEVGFFGTEKGNEFVVQNVKSKKVKNLYDAIVSGKTTVEEVMTHLSDVLPTDREQAEFQTLVAQEAMAAQAQQEAESSTPETRVAKLQKKLIEVAADPKLSPEEKQKKIQFLTGAIKGAQSDQAIMETIQSFFQVENAGPGGSLRIPGR